MEKEETELSSGRGHIKAWLDCHPGYLKQHREAHPVYVKKNRYIPAIFRQSFFLAIFFS
jgi:hypothetical protein